MTGSDFGNTLIGLGGNDTVVGNGGADFLRGGDGADRLNGGSGSDVLMGGRGADMFVFSAAIHSDPDANDILARGRRRGGLRRGGDAAGDRFDLAAIDANTTVAGNQGFVFGSTGAGGLRVLTSGADTVIRGNTDRDAGYEFEIVIEDGGVLASA